MTRSVQSPASMDQRRQFSQYAVSCLFLIFLLSAVFSVFFPEYSLAEDTEIVITSDTLEYFSETKQYVAKGSVEIKQEDAVITADEVVYFETTSDIIAVGKVRYHDPDTSMKAERAEMNLERKTGRIFDANIFFEKKDKIAERPLDIRAGRKTFLDIASIKDHFYLSGEEIEKRGENSYYSPSASFTACDAPIPAWCFKGKNVIVEEGLRAKEVSFRIKNVPVLYSPYIWVPIAATRETGFLMPTFSQSESLGFGLHVPFFWAISENRDATFVLDTFSRRGIGGGVEYRFIEPGDVKGHGWVYHIRDTELDKNFWELKGLYEHWSSDAAGGFLNINILNEKDFYRTFSTQLQTRTQRFLESTGELNFPLSNSRLYLLGQYWIDLKQEADNVPQKLPEAGYVLNYSKLGSSLISASISAANIWSDSGLSAGRLDIYPKLLHSFGRDFVVSQKAAVRATAYSYYNDGSSKRNIHRAAFEYDVVGHTRLYRKYDPFLHVIEPSVRYHFITSSENDLPVMDASELFGKTSSFELGLLNRLIVSGTEMATARVTQEIDTYNGRRPFLPLRLELAMNKWLPIKLDAKYNVYSGMVETLSSDLSLSVFKTNLAVGQTYNRVEDIMLFRAGLAFSPYKRVSLGGNVWYDSKGGGLRDMSLSMRYQRQCWGIRFDMIKVPDNYTMLVMFELTGISGGPSKNN